MHSFRRICNLLTAAIILAGCSNASVLRQDHSQVVGPRPCYPKLVTYKWDFDVHFERGRSTLNAHNTRILQESASKIMTQVDLDALVVTGHADTGEGNREKTMRLSLERAKRLKALLVQQGFPAQKIHTEGKGSAIPVASRDKRGKNQRVEIDVVGLPANRNPLADCDEGYF